MGTAAFWGRKAQQLEALVEQKGDPTIFYTMSIADNHFPEFYRLVTPLDTTCTPEKCVQAAITNAIMFNELAYHRMRDMVQSWVRDTLHAEYDYTRMEWQSRGVVHAHGCAKLKECPDMEQLTNAVIRGYVADLCLMDLDDHNVEGSGAAALHADIKEGERAKRELVCYAEWLLSAESPSPLQTPAGASVHVIPPHAKYARPPERPHPSSVRWVDVPVEDREADRACLLNTLFRHTSHGHSTCLRAPAKRKRIAAAAGEKVT